MPVTLVVVPDEEIVELLHLAAGPRRMCCGATDGLAVIDPARVTCPGCLEWLGQR